MIVKHIDMAQTLCIKCGSELKVSSYCQLCQEPLIFACTSCDYITEEKVHTDCRNAEVLAKTEAKEEELFTCSLSLSSRYQIRYQILWVENYFQLKDYLTVIVFASGFKS